MHHPSLSAAVVALLAVCALAAPAPHPPSSHYKRSFTVPVKPRSVHTRHPRREMDRIHAKFGWDALAAAGADSADASSADATASSSSTGTTTASSASGSESGEVSAIPEPNDAEYLEPVQIGTPEQTLNLDFDTGSADLWVFSNSLSSSESSGHNVFEPSKSSTWSDYNGASWSISYGDGSGADGTVGFDKVSIGGVTATRQAVELATSLSSSFAKDTNNDGLVGLAFKSINQIEPQAQNTFFENVEDQLLDYVFTANLETDRGGSYTFGAIDTDALAGDIHYTDVNTSSGFWQFASETYTVAGQPANCLTCSPAIADTGTSLLIVDDDVALAYYARVSGAQYSPQQGGFVFDCNADLPSFGVAIGNGYTATLNGSQLNYAPISDGTCFGGIQANSGQGMQIIGDILLKQFVAIFDGANARFGLADKA